MGQLDRNSSLYNRYIKTLNEQEDQLEQLRTQLPLQQEKQNVRREALEQQVQGMSVE